MRTLTDHQVNPAAISVEPVIERIALDDQFQAACQRYAHGNGSSHAIAAAAARASGVAGLLEALLAEQEWRERERDGAIDPEWDYEGMVGAKRRAALDSATA